MLYFPNVYSKLVRDSCAGVNNANRTRVFQIVSDT